MAWNPGTIQDLLLRGQFNVGLGRVGQEAERAIIEAVRQMQGAYDFQNPTITVITNANGTAQIARSSAGRFYMAIVTNTDNDQVGVVFSDGGDTIIVGGVICAAQANSIPGAAKVVMFASDPGAGQPVITDLRVRAFKTSDGTTGADNGCTVIVVHGA